MDHVRRAREFDAARHQSRIRALDLVDSKIQNRLGARAVVFLQIESGSRAIEKCEFVESEEMRETQDFAVPLLGTLDVLHGTRYLPEAAEIERLAHDLFL